MKISLILSLTLGSEATDYLWEEQALLKDSSELHLLDFSKLAVATDNFNEINKIGAGGFGPVYKVMPVSEVIHTQKITLLMRKLLL